MEFNHIEHKKQAYPLSSGLKDYLKEQSRYADLPINYSELQRYSDLLPHVDSKGNETLWFTVVYSPNEIDFVKKALVKIYQMLNADGSNISYLNVGSIDFCSYGNSQPFRIKIVNELNDNHDYFYIKKPDASRVYGIELEHLFSPNKMNYIVNEKSLVEEHIIGIPGDEFIKKNLNKKVENRVRLAKEFVKFNERCFVRLLGDMRAYNFVVVINQDFDNVQYRIRAMDFDQQSYEGRKNQYLPQYYKDNLALVNLAQEVMSMETAEQYMNEERAVIRKRYNSAKGETESLFEALKRDEISTTENIEQLKTDLEEYYKNPKFKECTTMGEVLILNFKTRLNLK